MSLGFSPNEQRAWMEKYRPHVEQKVGTPVIAFLPFHRPSAVTEMVAERVSSLAGNAIRLIGRKRAGGLPPNFILVLTDQRIHAYTSKAGANSFELKDEVAVWDRSGIRLSAQETPLHTRLTIESPTGGEKVVVEATKAALTADFFGHLSLAEAA
jgi:hypothetical protein